VRDWERDLAGSGPSELLAGYRHILRRLRELGVVRSGNAPTGDYAELLVQRATGGELAPASQRSWDVLTPDGEQLQVKARTVTDPLAMGERQLSVFRSWDFSHAVIVLFDADFGVWRATRLAVGLLRDESGATFIGHVNGWRVVATDGLLDRGEDWTDRLRGVVE
jgi:hypothetical protein